MKFRIVSFIIVIILLFNYSIVFADLEDNESIDVDKIKEEMVETSATATDKLNLNSRVAVIYDRASGRILYEKNGNKQTPMASTTKIMTAIVVLENSKLTDVVTIDQKAAGTGGSRLGLKKNDKITVNDLLYGLMLRSGNDAAVALATYISGDVNGFVKLMNKKAEELGLVNTHFVVPHGLDMPGHYTTGFELAKIADYALNIKKIKEIVSTKSYTVTINGSPRVISNTNELLGNLNGVYGIKTGFTNGAGRCLVTACKRGNLDVITVVIGADTKKYRTSDSIKLVEYAYKNFKLIDVKTKINEQFEEWKRINQKRIYVNKGINSNVELEMENIPYKQMAVKNTQVDDINVEINSLYYFEAPVEQNKVVGNLKVMVGDEVVTVLQIYTKTAVSKKSIQDYFMEFMKMVCFD